MNAVRIVLSSFIVQGRKTITNLLFHIRVKRDDIMTRLTDYKEPHPPPSPPHPKIQNMCWVSELAECSGIQIMSPLKHRF